MSEPLSEVRRRFAREVLRDNGLDSPRLEEALAAVPRE